MGFGMLHLPEPAAAAREAWRVLTVGGRFAFSVWDEPAGRHPPGPRRLRAQRARPQPPAPAVCPASPRCQRDGTRWHKPHIGARPARGRRREGPRERGPSHTPRRSAASAAETVGTAANGRRRAAGLAPGHELALEGDTHRRTIHWGSCSPRSSSRHGPPARASSSPRGADGRDDQHARSSSSARCAHADVRRGLSQGGHP